MTQAGQKVPEPEQANESLYCSFCLKPAEEVKKLVAGRGRIFICDECVAACNDYITLGTSERSRSKPLQETSTEKLLTLLKPVEETIEGKSNQLQSLGKRQQWSQCEQAYPPISQACTALLRQHWFEIILEPLGSQLLTPRSLLYWRKILNRCSRLDRT
jgi:hypothetical protein